MFNISNAKVEERKFTRSSAKRGQNYKFKYRSNKKGHAFQISDELFEELGLKENALALIPSRESSDPDSPIVAVALVVLPKDHEKSTFLTGSEGKKKSPKFNNTILESTLSEAGVIDSSPEAMNTNQKLDLELFADGNINFDEDGIPFVDKNGYPLYVIVKDNSVSEYDEDEEEEEEEEVAEEV